MEDTKTQKKKFTEGDMLHLASLIDVANSYSVPWMTEVIQAIQAPTARQRESHLRKLEQAIALEATRIDNPHSRAKRVLAHIRVNPSALMTDEQIAALLIASEVSAGVFRSLGFLPEPEHLTTANGDEEEKIIGFYIYDPEPLKAKRKTKPRPEPEDDE